MEDSRPLKTLLVILFAIIIAVIVTMIFFLRDKTTYGLPVEFAASNEKTDAVAPGEPAGEEPAEDPFETPAVPERYIVDHHTVVKDESFSLVTGIYWDDVYLWPDLYIRNDMKSDDPDIIYPDEIIDIYNRLGHGNLYNDIEKDEILKAYIEVYDIYKKLGPEKENSVWALLYSGAKYDHDFLDLFSDRIDPADKAMAQKYIDEEGYLD
ncbi:MAG: hypothetical protein JXR86_13635 [Spirochaetales bacterium]|nr:hypothetical protein [Spirochaetales bacterium]